jgi:lysophospholipase L1-like esterase
MKVRNPLSFLSLLLIASLSTSLSAQTQAPRTIDPTRFNEDIEAFEATDEEMLPPEGAIVVTGSSSIRRWHPSIREDLAPLTIIPRGFGGSTMADLQYFLDRIVIKYEPRAVVIYEGDNDTGAFGVPPEQIAEEFRQIVTAVHHSLPQTRFYLISVKPSLARREYWDVAQETNELYMEMAAQSDKIFYIDIATQFLDANGVVMDDIFVEDGLHLNEKGTRIWANTIKAALMPNEAHYE